MMRAMLWASVVAAGAAAAYLVVGYVVALRLSAPTHQPVERTPASVGLDYREVGLRSSDGLALRAWWIGKRGSSRAVLLVHGFSGDKSDPHVVETAHVYHRAGFDVLMLDLRANGESEGERVTLGYREVRDVRAALSWLERRGFEPSKVVLHGWSMGGATVVRAAPAALGAAPRRQRPAHILQPGRLPDGQGVPGNRSLGGAAERGRTAALGRRGPVHDHPLPRRRGDPLRARRVVRCGLPRGRVLGAQRLRTRRGPHPPREREEAPELPRRSRGRLASVERSRRAALLSLSG